MHSDSTFTSYRTLGLFSKSTTTRRSDGSYERVAICGDGLCSLADARAFTTDAMRGLYRASKAGRVALCGADGFARPNRAGVC